MSLFKYDFYHEVLILGSLLIVIATFVTRELLMFYTYSKKEKLKSKKLIDQMFSEGQSISVFPLRLVYLPASFEESIFAKTGVSVSKRNFKTAVDRNRIKRLLRESYRLNKSRYFNNISTQYALMILYIGKDQPSYQEVEKKMNLLFDKFSKKISK
ncbi:ribonuclease P protein component [Cognatitamlana onchidii]|uniref:ribonuclease P protein component n=1 Tax=Cognatitamlana onchidii TaxID=2562860 RepID=UPI002939284E|nr:ribonuclease P protein component [Algibacter onchidii]